jgi:hypothetical protein
MNGTCRLCQQQKELRRSHIIPEFCYKAAYEDTIHRATALLADPNGKTYVQKGFRDNLLCDDCEQFLNKNYENPFKTRWYDGGALPDPVPAPASPGDDLIVVTGLDYTTFKLFHLSILWRASVATGDRFNTVSLGPYEEKVRQVLLNKDAGPVDHYPMFGLLLVKDQRRVCYGMVSKIQQSRYGRSHAYYACYAGVEWNTIVTDHPGPEELQMMPTALAADGTMPLAVIPFERSSTTKTFVAQRDGRAGAHA